MTSDLEARIQRLEDIEAIRSLKVHYCDLCDRGYNADALTALFTPDAIWDGGIFGRYEGAKRIHRFFSATGEIVRFAHHYVTNSVVEVTGDTAAGQWYLLQAASMPRSDGVQAFWGSARYDEEYLRTRDGWKFTSVAIEWAFWTPYEEGWEKLRFQQ